MSMENVKKGTTREQTLRGPKITERRFIREYSRHGHFSNWSELWVADAPATPISWIGPTGTQTYLFFPLPSIIL